jgi:hypothetical protein
MDPKVLLTTLENGRWGRILIFDSEYTRFRQVPILWKIQCYEIDYDEDKCTMSFKIGAMVDQVSRSFDEAIDNYLDIDWEWRSFYRWRYYSYWIDNLDIKNIG